MPFTVSYPTRHTDTFAATGFVHAGVLLALTELAYADYERAVGVVKPASIIAVQRATEAVYHAPLPWPDGARLSVTTDQVSERGFRQHCIIVSAASSRRIATITHHWVWLDTATGRAGALPADVQALMIAFEQRPA